MSKEELRKVGAQVSEEVLVSLKILALKARVTLGAYVKEVLDKHVRGKGREIDKAEEV